MTQPMTTHALFYWSAYEASGGMGDLVLIGTLEECERAFAGAVEGGEHDISGHVVEISSFDVVCDAFVKAVRAPHKTQWQAPDSYEAEFVRRQA